MATCYAWTFAAAGLTCFCYQFTEPQDLVCGLLSLARLSSKVEVDHGKSVQLVLLDVSANSKIERRALSDVGKWFGLS